jgi:hypothetical protein
MYQCVCDFYCAATQLKAPRTVLGIVRYTNLIGLDWIGLDWIYLGYVVAQRFNASVASDLQACNQCLCGVWVQSRLAALDMLHRIKGIFGTDHIPVVSSGHSGFLYHKN